MLSFDISTTARQMQPITRQVQQLVRESGVQNGLCLVFCPHTTAAITINENADPDVVEDLLFALDKTFPDRPEFRHMEGNSAAHLKASCVGESVTVPVLGAQLQLGRWQGIYFCEFDGPRHRTVWVQTIGEY